MNSDREILINSLQKGVNLAKDKVRGEGEAFSWGDVAYYIIADGWIRPPVKVGEKVYKITRNKVKECEVVFIGISANEKCSYFNFVENYADGTFYKSYSMVFDVIGKTVFLTKEEAEAELRKRVKDNG